MEANQRKESKKASVTFCHCQIRLREIVRLLFLATQIQAQSSATCLKDDERDSRYLQINAIGPFS